MDGINEHFTLLTRFALAMGLVLLMPKLMERMRLPGVLGFIFAGVLLGPNSLGIIKQDGPVITLLAEIGKLLFMFFVGFEIDLEEFKKSRSRSLIFGLLTFLLPFLCGIALGHMTGNGWNSSIVIGSLIASHTLLAFPIVQRLGIHLPRRFSLVGVSRSLICRAVYTERTLNIGVNFKTRALGI